MESGRFLSEGPGFFIVTEQLTRQQTGPPNRKGAPRRAPFWWRL